MAVPPFLQTGDLSGRTLVITRPPDSAAVMVRQIRARGGRPVRLPGLSLRAAADTATLREALRTALTDEFIVFVSPSAVRFASAVLPLITRATVVAIGPGTSRALARHGLTAIAPLQHQDSEALLALPCFQSPHGRRVALVGATTGRGLLSHTLAERGAFLREVHVYRHVPPRLDARHERVVQSLPADTCILLSSAAALQNLERALSGTLWQKLCDALAVTSSARLATLAAQAGFVRVKRAASAQVTDLLAASVQANAAGNR